MPPPPEPTSAAGALGQPTPAMRQYLEAKRQHRDAIVFFRMGDFYETFFEDALVASRALELTLTSRSKDSSGGAIPMCGVPYHAVDGYLARLVKKGFRVAICEQVEDPRKAKGLVRREVVRVVSPGTFTDAAYLDAREPAFLMALAPAFALPRRSTRPSGRSGAAAALPQLSGDAAVSAKAAGAPAAPTRTSRSARGNRRRPRRPVDRRVHERRVPRRGRPPGAVRRDGRPAPARNRRAGRPQPRRTPARPIAAGGTPVTSVESWSFEVEARALAA